MTIYNVGYLIGSLAKASINRKLAKALIQLAPEQLQFTEIPFGDLPLYSYDYDADYPPVARAFKRRSRGRTRSSSSRRNIIVRYPEVSRMPSTGRAGPMELTRLTASPPP